MLQCTEPGRIFIDITRGGCPCACRYCFVETGKEFLVTDEEIASLPGRLSAHSSYLPGPRGTLLTFGSNCDLFRTPGLAAGLIRALGEVTRLGNPIQISTKHRVRRVWASRIASLRKFKTQVVIFISCATISRASHYEPRTPPPEERFDSFGVLRDYEIPSCLFIKPFIPGVTDRDASTFINVVRTRKPDAVCVGTFYLSEPIVERIKVSRDVLSEGPKHPLMKDSTWVVRPERRFINSLEVALPQMSVFQNSACVVAYLQGAYCPTLVWRNFPALCVGCQDCDALYKEVIPAPALLDKATAGQE